MEKRIKMYNPKTGESKNGFIGFSWPILFLAWIPMFARGDIRSGLELIAVQLGCLAIQSCGFQSFYWIFIFIQVVISIVYNNYYTKRLIDKGFLFNDTDELNEIGANSVGIFVGGCQLNNDAISFQLPLTWNLAKSAIVRSTISRVLDTTIDFLLKRANQCLCLPLFCSRYTVCDLL